MKTKHLVAVIVALLLVFCLVVGLMPNFVESKSLYDVYTYKSQILDKNAITEVKIEIDADEFQDMLDNPTDEEEKEANVVINGYKVDNVSIRTKGNSSLTNVASDSTSDRYSFKIDFEAYNDQNLLGLTKLNLNNCYSDPSYMREYVSYCLMEEMGLPTPAFAFTRIYINGELWGLYLGVEQVNSTFINANFSDEDGDLYKLDGTSLRLEDGETAAEYVEENEEGLGLKTNKKSADYSSIENLIEVINNGGDLESVMDVDEVIRYFAANTALVNVDSYITSMFHNIYLYEEDGVFSIIPWDFDLSMGVFSTDMGGGGGPGGDGEGGGPGGDETFSPPDALSESTTDTSESESTTSQNMMPTAPPTENSTTEDTSDSTDTASADTSSDTTSTTDSPEMNGQNGGGFGGGGPGGNRGGQGGMGDDENEGGGGGGGMGSQTIKLTDDMIDFPIDTPVSGYDLPSYPLINAWIQNVEYKELYHEYLKEIAEGFMSASRIKTLVAETMNMISTDVANDPNSNFTTEEFQSECESIISFCTQRSASILGQLDGTIDSTKESTGTVTARGAGGGDGMGDGEMPTDMENMPDFDGEMAAPGENTTDESTSSETSSDTENSDSTVSSDTTDETTENTTERTQMDFPGGGGQGGDGNAMGGGGMGGGGPGGATTQTTTYTSGNLAAYLVSGIVLIVAVLFILFFKRRGRKKFIS